MTDYTAKIERTITAQQICDLVITALEGGSNYWLESAMLARPVGPARKRLVMEKPWYATAALYGLDDWCINVAVSEEDPPKVHWLNRAAVTSALCAMATTYPAHLLDIIDDNADADTADVFLQLALFSEIVYG